MTDVVNIYYRFVAGSAKVDAEDVASAASQLLHSCCLPLAIPLSDILHSPSRWALLNYRIFVVSAKPLVMVLVPHVFKLETIVQGPDEPESDYNQLISPMSHGSYTQAPYLTVRLIAVSGRGSRNPTLVNRLEFTNLVPAQADSLVVGVDQKTPIALEQALQSSQLNLHAAERPKDGTVLLQFQ